jgi:DNA-binding CsgD family transcriptional regulator
MANANLTETEKQVKHLIEDEFLTVKQICSIRECSRQAVYKIIKKLKQKGRLNNKVDNFVSTTPFCQPTLPMRQVQQVRLHGQEFHIKILWQDNKYQERLTKGNVVWIDGNTIRLYQKAIEVYSGQSFMADNEQQAEKKALDYWQHFFARLEQELSVIVIKPRVTNIRVVNQHYARTNSDVAKNAIERKQRVRVFAADDGKLAFITDDSFGFKEDETVHPINAKPHRQAIDKQIKDWMLNNPPTLTELSTIVYDVTKNQLMFAENMTSHIEAIKKLGSEVENLAKTIKEFKQLDK